MNPGRGGHHHHPTHSLALTTLLAALAALAPALAAPPETRTPHSGNVGCLFSDFVCNRNEACFDDLVIGRCVSASSRAGDVAGPGQVSPLAGPALALLEAELGRALDRGFPWSHPFTQCVAQTVLADIAAGQLYTGHQCGPLQHSQHTQTQLYTDDTDQQQEDELEQVVERLPEFVLVPEPAAEESDEEEDEEDQDQIFFVSPEDLAELYLNSGPDSTLHPLEKREIQLYSPLEDDEEHWQELPSSYGYVVSQPDADYLISPRQDAGYILPDTIYDDLYETNPPGPVPLQSDHQADRIEELEESDWRNPVDDIPNQRTNDESGLMMQDELYNDDSANDISNYDFDDEDSSEVAEDDDVLYYGDDTDPLPVETLFNRRERLDVKKPGPFYTNSPNNFFLDKLLPEAETKDEEEMEEDLGQTEYELREKKAMTADLASYTEPAAQQPDWLYVNIKGRFRSLTQAEELRRYVADHLELPLEVFSEFRPETSRIVLRVSSNPRQLSAGQMAELLEKDAALREHASADLDLDLESFAAGDAESAVVSSAALHGRSNLAILLFLLTSGIAGLIICLAVMLFIRKRKLQKTKIPEPTKLENEEPVKEYKQLVRDWSRSSRASQGSTASTAGPEQPPRSQPPPATTSPHKNGHKSSHNSEGSRNSSTSSWQEEPGVSTMDISTGHMVLSYMEDHLKNKQRLEQEWVGLCAYEAEPNSTSIAFKVENKKKNRYPDKLPYDHNRVLVNALVNGSNSDYINASTVMDHDPRNPAYIVTQGPLTHTVADFWQMVWEQGSVVIVMLSRLAENGYHLAQRYWPEEGSEQYHIFEVHLVSEHVWCEEYLVRSLYLKNSQTGETRTVTQFHFLSWPDGNIPTSTKAILEFRRKVNKSYRGRSCPVIVHCSDGVGRAGTYVLIDMVLNRMMKGSKEIDIAATLEHIRDQRAGMVQTRSQFEFCLMAVAEETHAILKALPQ